MTDTTRDPNAPGFEAETDGAAVKRPDQKGANRPADTPAKPATGGDGAAGAGGTDGFGTGS